MTEDERRSRLLRIVTGVLAVALVVAIGLNLAGRLRSDDSIETVDTDDEVLSVAGVLGAPEGQLRTVRGFVFEDALGLRLCEGRESDPVACVGPFVDLVGFDPASVELDETERDGREVFYSADPVTLVGTLSLTTFTVEDIVAES